MRFYCDKQIIAAAVFTVSKATVSKSTLKAIEGVHIKLTGNNLQLTGFNLEIGIRTNIQVKGDDEGEIVLNARLFGEILRKMPDGEIMLSSNDRFLTEINGSEVLYTIIGTDPAEFPALPELYDYESIKMEQPILKSIINQTIFAASTDQNRPVLNGAKFDINEGLLTVSALDGYRLAVRKQKIEAEGNYSFVVPSKTLNEISKLLSDDDEFEVQLSIGKKHIIFKINDYIIISRLLEGDFLDYAASLQKEATTQIKISVRAFINSLDRTSLLINENTITPVRCNFADDKLNISCITALGKIYDAIPVKISGAPLEIGFNNRFLTDALKASETDEVLLKISGPLSPMKIVPLDGDEFLFLVLPMRL